MRRFVCCVGLLAVLGAVPSAQPPTGGWNGFLPVYLPAPVAGADWSVQVPSGHTWRVVSAYGCLTTSAVPGIRGVRLIIRDPQLQIVRLHTSLFYHGESTFARYQFTHSNHQSTALTTGTLIAADLGAELWVLPGWWITSTSGLAPGDQWDHVFLLVEDWLTS